MSFDFYTVEVISLVSKMCPSLQVFGEVAEGFETLTRINEAYVDEKSKPYKNIRFVLIFFLLRNVDWKWYFSIYHF